MSDRDFSSCPHLRSVREYNQSCKPQVVLYASVASYALLVTMQKIGRKSDLAEAVGEGRDFIFRLPPFVACICDGFIFAQK